jgi:hypothetical protein
MQGIYYGLKIMKSIIEQPELKMNKIESEEFKNNKIKFYKRFTENDGFGLLCSTLETFEVDSLLKDVVWLSIYQMMIDILQIMLEDKLFISIVSKNKKDENVRRSTTILVSVCSNILLVASSNVKMDRDLKKCLLSTEDLDSLPISKIESITKEYEKLEISFYYSTFILLKNCLKLCPEEINLFYKSNFIKKGGFVALIATHSNKETVRKINEAIVELCRTLKDEEVFKVTPASFFLELLTNHLENILSLDTLNYEFFDLWDKMIRLVKPVGKDIKPLAELLFNTITNRPIIEDEFVLDPVLAGSLLMLDTLDEFYKPFLQETVPKIYSSEFLYFLMSKGLFSRERVSADNSEITYPICKHDITRKYALQLLSQLFGKNSLEQVAAFLEPLIKNGSWRTNKREKWFIQASKLAQRTTHVGLVNLGCTCYMNSLMQQLFMSPFFRSFICSAVDQKREELPVEDNVLYQTKYLFANLMKTKMPTYNPIVFFNSIKDYTGEPMPTNEQRDVDEFLNIYMDKIEQNIKGTEDDRYLQSIFGGSFAQELICKDCPHRSSREEQFLSVNVEIK